MKVPDTTAWLVDRDDLELIEVTIRDCQERRHNRIIGLWNTIAARICRLIRLRRTWAHLGIYLQQFSAIRDYKDKKKPKKKKKKGSASSSSKSKKKKEDSSSSSSSSSA